jgi:O-antigen/teichoic acid export membrane protein
VPVALHKLDAAERTAAFVFLAFIPLNMLALYLMSVVSGLESYGWFQLIRSAGVVVTLVALAWLALTGRLSVMTAVVSYVIANVVMLALAAGRVRALVDGRLSASREVARSLLGFGVRSHVGTVGSFLSTRLDQLVISLLLAPARLGVYAVSLTLTALTTLVGSSVASVGVPAVARVEDEEARRWAARDLVALTMLTASLVTLPLLVFMPSVVSLLFGPAWEGAVRPARILLVGAVALSTSQALGAVLRAVGHPLHAGIAEFAALPVLVVGLAALLPAAGLTGAAVASVLAYATATAWMLRLASRALGLHIRELFPRPDDASRLRDLLRLRRPPSAPAEDPA